MDESLEFGLPDAEARQRMVRLYFDKLIARGEDAGDDAPARGLLGAMGIGKGGKRGGGKEGDSDCGLGGCRRRGAEGGG